ncbi:unnamed protein product, partial [Allacma fusca]
TLKSARKAEENALETSTVESDTDNEVLSIGRTRQRRKQPCQKESKRSDSEERETTNHCSNLALLTPEQEILQDTFLNPPNHPHIPTPIITWDLDIGSGSDCILLERLLG